MENVTFKDGQWPELSNKKHTKKSRSEQVKVRARRVQKSGSKNAARDLAANGMCLPDLCLILYTCSLSCTQGPFTNQPKLDELIHMFESGTAQSAAPVIEFDDTMDAEAVMEPEAVDGNDGDADDDGDDSEDA